MNAKKTGTIPGAKTRSHATVEGALLWGTVYTTATTGATYAVASNIDAEPLTLSHVLAEAMAMFYPFGAVRGLLMWYARNRRPDNRIVLRGMWLRRFRAGKWNRI